MQDHPNGPQGLFAEIDAYLGEERLWNAWLELDELTEDMRELLADTSAQLEGGSPRPELCHGRDEYEHLSERLSDARGRFDAEVGETVRLLDERAAWRVMGEEA